ncbi:MAG: hypothetical protein HY278_03485 [candidate division NC10 bacterium]|nr:hypothetical protein [candidate division NC10 bacterium]
MDFMMWFENALGPIRWRPDGNGAARCPFHDDRRPSLSVHRWKGAWKCFAGCGHGGIRDLAERLGVRAPWRWGDESHYL